MSVDIPVRTRPDDGWLAVIPRQSITAWCPKCAPDADRDSQCSARLELDGSARMEIEETDANLEDPISCSACRAVALNPLPIPKNDWVGTVEIEALSVGWELCEWNAGTLVKNHGHGRHEIASAAQMRVAVYAGISTLLRTAFDGFAIDEITIETPTHRWRVTREAK